MTVVRHALPWLVLASGLVACNNQKPPEPPARFEQPNSVDFVCVVNDLVTTLAKCEGDDSENNGIALHALVTQHARGEVAAIDMQAFRVLDSRRDIPGYTFVPVGELPVAVVVPPHHPQLTYVADFGSRDVRVLRTQGLVTPAVGSPDVQTVTLMTSSAAGSVAVAPTHMELAPDEDALIVTAPDQGRVLWLPIIRCPSVEGASETTDCADYGQIDVANIASIDLNGSVDRIAPVAAPAADPVRYEKLCGFEEAAPEPAPDITVSDEMLAPAPRPSGLAIDAFCLGDQPCTRRILVSDEALPLIHAIDIAAITPGSDGSDALLAPIVVGVATKAVAVTPRVPVAIGNDDETQYVYAIDATDGSVLATENGRVINVNAAPSVRPDRIALVDTQDLGSPPAAVALTVMHPLFQLDAPAGQYVKNTTAIGEPPAIADFSCTDDESHTEEDPARLRGVFLAIATIDGSVRIVDVHDMELLDEPDPKDKDKTTSCRPCPTEVRAPILIRNRERIALTFATEEGDEPIPLTPEANAFAFIVDGLAYNLRPDGTSGSVDAPSLECIACDSAQSVVFPPASEDTPDETITDADGGADVGQDRCGGKTPALLCANDDPWTTSEETWVARYEAVIPGANGANALFVAPGDAGNVTGSPEIAAPLDFCAAGVLGGDSIAAAYAGDSCSDDADAPAGDQIAITSAFLGESALKSLLMPSGATAEQTEAANATAKKCADATKALEDDATLIPAFSIRRAYRDRLVIDATLARDIGTLHTFTDVQQCLGGLPMTYVVRTTDSFLVTGVLSSFTPQVKADAAGRCVVDADADRLSRGRTRLGCTFRNHAFTIRLRKPALDDAVQEPPGGLALQIRMISPATKLICNVADVGFGAASVVPVQLRYNDVDRQLYLVDIQDRGVVPIELDPFPPGIDDAFTFN